MTDMAEPLTVLVAEDNAINQKVVVKMLERLGTRPLVAENGEEAVARSAAERFDLVFMDVQMPVMDGLSATRAIRAAEAGDRQIIIIALTANAMQGDRERCLESGMDDYLAKPVKQSDIEAMLVKWFPERFAASLAAVASAPTVPSIIDPKRIEQIKEIGDDALLKELLNLYLSDLDQFQTDMAAAIAAKDTAAVYECAHKLKGSSANLGIESIRESCIVLEQHAKSGQHDALSLQFADLLRTVAGVRTHIAAVYR